MKGSWSWSWRQDTSCMHRLDQDVASERGPHLLRISLLGNPLRLYRPCTLQDRKTGEGEIIKCGMRQKAPLWVLYQTCWPCWAKQCWLVVDSAQSSQHFENLHRDYLPTVVSIAETAQTENELSAMLITGWSHKAVSQAKIPNVYWFDLLTGGSRKLQFIDCRLFN